MTTPNYKAWFLLFFLNIIILECHAFNFPTLSRTVNPRIVGGEKAETADSKHVVSIRLKLNEKIYGFGNGHICGGTLIARYLVLTASHCLLNTDLALPTLRHFTEFTVVMGILNLNDKDGEYLQFDVKSFAHRKFNPENFKNDVALMYLVKTGYELKYDYIVPMPLATEKPKDGTNCTVHGWGATEVGGPANEFLMKLEVPLLSKKNCTSSYKNRILGGMFCAGFLKGGKDSCQGDSGGPLVCDNKLVGVVSWGEKCAEPYHPGVYADVSYYKQWINTNFNYTNEVKDLKSGFVATIRFKSIEASNPGGGIIAGGSLINGNTILTTAHSLYYPEGLLVNPEQLEVGIGNYLKTPHFHFDVKKIEIHEEFNLKTKKNNIALLTLTKNVTQVEPIKISNSPSEDQTNCVTYGFNTKITEFTGYSIKVQIFGADNLLQFSNVRVLSNKHCKPKYSNHLENDWMCAGNLDSLQDENQPEEGGPLACNGKLVGLGFNRSLIAIQGFPTQYIDVYKHRKWLSERSGSNSIFYGIKILPFIIMLKFIF